MLDFITTLLTSFGLIFIAELGDKTQLVILTCAAKGYSAKKIAIGASIGFAIIVVFGGIISSILTRYIDINWIKIISAVVFIVIGGIQIIGLIKQSLKNKNSTENIDAICETDEIKKKRSAIVTGMVAILGMEMGDKTQIMTIMLASSSDSMIAALIGSWLALSVVAIIGAFSGKWLSEKVPQHIIDWIAAILFVFLGILMLVIG